MRRMYSEHELSQAILNILKTSDVEVKTLKAFQSIKSLDKIIDASGNPRFIEGDGTPNSALQDVYCKWSLSGTHLMCVVSGTLPDTTALSAYAVLAEFEIPQWVYDKIKIVWQSTMLAIASLTMYADNFTSQTHPFYIQKNNGKVYVTNNAEAFTLTADRKFRLQFDLLIDAEEEE